MDLFKARQRETKYDSPPFSAALAGECRVAEDPRYFGKFDSCQKPNDGSQSTAGSQSKILNAKLVGRTTTRQYLMIKGRRFPPLWSVEELPALLSVPRR
jgi:hypothetical protein